MKNLSIKKMTSYFFLAIAILVAYRIVIDADRVLAWVGRGYLIVSPFITGFAIAYILGIPCEKMKGWLKRSKKKFIVKHSNLISVLLIFILFISLVTFLLQLVIPFLFRNIRDFVMEFPSYYKNVQSVIDSLNSLSFMPVELSLDLLLSAIQKFGLESLSASFSAIMGVSSAIFRGFLALVSSIYILLEKEKLVRFFSRLFRALFHVPTYRFLSRHLGNLNSYFHQYIRCQTIDGCILGTVATIELLILRSPYALTLGIMLGVVNYIPYFGSIFGSLLAVVVVAMTQGLTTGAIALVVLIVTQQIDGNLIQPRLMGGSFSISPFLIVISITVGGALKGPLGMIIAIPIVAVLKDILEELLTLMEQRKGHRPAAETDGEAS